MSDKYYIVDLDGTLYFQIPVRFMMICELIWYYIRHLSKAKTDLGIIYDFRRLHDEKVEINLAVLAEKYKVNHEYVSGVIEKWMIERPLKWIKLFADRRLIKVLQNKKVIVFSDYPTERKLQALGFEPLGQCYYDSKHINHYKPHPQGLEYISRKFNINKEDMLVLGDRYSHDGICAKRFGCRYFILKKTCVQRLLQYRKIR